MVCFRLVIVCLVALLALGPWASSSLGAPAPQVQALKPAETGHAPGIVLVGLKAGTQHSGNGDLLAGNGTPAAPGRARQERAIPGIGVRVVRVEPGKEQQWLAYLRADPRVAFAELDHRVTIADDPQSAPASAGAPVRGQAITPNDPSLTKQWALATLRMPEAWQKTTGAPDAIIAIVDTGIATAHPDLAGKLWTNSDEIAGNGRDDDGNGKIDDIHGWRFYHTYSGDVYEAADDGVIEDEHGHGTHVAGIAAAAANNGIGVAGISWGARIMAVRALDGSGSGWFSDVAAAVIYAADNGARVINLSLGDAEPSTVMCEAIQYAHSRGALVVAATGNSGGAVFCPATCPQALGVAASDSADKRASFSNFGPEVDVTAPGSVIYSTWPRLDGYTTLSGTSMAAAYVSGLASLVWSLRPALDPDAVARQLMRTAVDIDTPGVDPRTGYGRIDAAAATGPLSGDWRVLLPLLVNQQAIPSLEPTAKASPSGQAR